MDTYGGNEMSIHVGFGRRCITPLESVPMAGYGNTTQRMSGAVKNDIFATCVAFTDDQNNTLLMITLDMLHAHEKWTEGIRDAIGKSFGVPGDHIMVAHTHTHSAPDSYNALDCTERYRLYLTQQCEEAAKEALDDRCAAKLYAGVRVMQQNMNHIRNYITDASAPEGKRHAGEPDRRLQLVRIKREGANEIVLMNWQAHATLDGGLRNTNISADYIGYVRKYMEEETGALFSFYQGASGNVTAGSKLTGETITRNSATYGSLLGEWSMYLYKELENAEPLQDDRIRTSQVVMQVPIDHSDDHRLEDAKKVRAFWVEKNSYAICTPYAKSFGMNSVYHASGIIMRAARGESAEMVLDVVSVGSLAFVCAPFEMYSVHGSYIKDASPFDMTFIVTSCNTLHGYLAEDKAFDYGCYEVDFRRYPRGTAEKVAETFVSMLKEIKAD